MPSTPMSPRKLAQKKLNSRVAARLSDYELEPVVQSRTFDVVPD
jgi:hypothetical protein